MFPDLEKLDAAQRVSKVAGRQADFVAGLHALGPYNAVSLRYLYQREPGREGRIRLFLLGRSFGDNGGMAEERSLQLRDLVQRTFPREYFLVEMQADTSAAVRKAIALDDVVSLTEILKPEQTVPAWHDPRVCGFSRYYLPGHFAAANDNSMVDFCRALTATDQYHDVVVDICLVPALPLTEVEQGELKNWAVLCEKWGRDQEEEGGGGLFTDQQRVRIVADPHARSVGDGYASLLKRYAAPQRLFLSAIRVLWWQAEPPVNVATSLAANALTTGSQYHLISLDRRDAAFQKAWNAARLSYVTPAVCHAPVWRHPEAPETLRRLHRLTDVSEIANFFRLPIPGRDGCPGMPLDSGFGRLKSAEDEKPLVIGAFVEGNRVTTDQATFTRSDLITSALIVGMPGSGKTTLCLSLLTQLWRDHRIPFLVVEPAKNEYRILGNLKMFSDDLRVFTVGNERAAPFRFNPFEVLKGVNVAEHISTLNTCFGGAFNLWEPLPHLLDQAIKEVYADNGWSEYAVGGDDPDLLPPTMEDLYVKALLLARNETSYRGETAGNIVGALETRLGSLLRGPKGRCFNTARSVPLAELMQRPVILELDALNNDEKALMMMFVLTLVREYAKTNRSDESPLSHVLLIEEAHNVIGRGQGHAGGQDRANPQGVAIRFFTNMLAEMRAWGEGIIVADQLPTAIAPEVVKQTNIKVMHRIVAADDREELGRAMVFDSAQVHQAVNLPVGMSYVFAGGWPRSRLVQESNFMEEHGLKHPPDNDELGRRMAPAITDAGLRETYLPYRACLDVCRVCHARIREEMERRTQKALPQILAEFSTKGGRDVTSLVTDIFLAGYTVPSVPPDQLTGEEKTRQDCFRVHWTTLVERMKKCMMRSPHLRCEGDGNE
ncbi:MAG: hypothetical protein BWK76_11900 [Desulfobulbaceae bacterium A2]|nr:MAG: hypothetical protein BWK76_11900 [Desulfobulbaceae bacterium A2]